MGLVGFFLVIAAIILGYEGIKAFNRYRALKAAGGAGESVKSTCWSGWRSDREPRPATGDGSRIQTLYERRQDIMSEEGKKKGGLFQAIKEFVYGVAAHDSARFALKITGQHGAPVHPHHDGGHARRPHPAPLLFACGCCPTWCPRSPPGSGGCCREKDLTDALA